MSTGKPEPEWTREAAPTPPATGGRWRAALRRSLTIAFLLAVSVAVAFALRGQDWSVLTAAIHDRRPVYFASILAASVICNAVALLLAMVAWRAVLSGLGEHISQVAAARIFLVGQFAKFVPGKVLGFVVSIQMGKAVGVAASRMLAAWLLTAVVILLTGATIGLAAGPDVAGGSVWWLVLAAAPTVAVLVRPALVDRLAVTVARRLKRPPPAVSARGRGVRRAVVAQALAWVLGGVHLWLLAVAMGASPARSFLLSVGAYSLATVAGMLVVFAPEGIGVREVVLLAALSVALPLPVASVVVLVSRLVTTFSEVATAGFGLLVAEYLRRRRRRDQLCQSAGDRGSGMLTAGPAGQ